MEIRDLRSFVTIARAGSFSRAASEVETPQPALSRQMRKLEGELGVDLLVRHGKGVSPTPAGWRLLDRAEAILQQMDIAEAELRGAESGAGGEAGGEQALGIAGGCPDVLGAALADAAAAVPGMALHLREAGSATLESWLGGGQLGLALMYEAPPIVSLVVKPLLTERLVLVGRPDAPVMARREPVHLREALAERLILPGSASRIRRALGQAAWQHGAPLQPAIEVDSSGLIRAMLRQGQGCSVMTEAAVQQDVAAGLLATRPIDRPNLTVTLSLVLPAVVPAERADGKLPLLVAGVVQALVAGGHWAGATLLRGAPETTFPLAAE